ncbi:MAG: 2-amino-4-hydroxy-6-hydroxymethyldihydropteridine diphosphokinase [Pseudomonadota bacterium]
MSSPDSIINRSNNRVGSGTIADLPAVAETPLCLVGLGANLDSHVGSPEETLHEAIRALSELSDYPAVTSSLWRSRPLDCPPGSPDFINAVLAFLPRNAAQPLALLRDLQQIESAFGRVRQGVLNAPRPLDLDLLMCGEAQMSSEELTLPHPRISLRGFVLAPLAEIAPGLLLPGQTQSVEKLLEGLADAGDWHPVKAVNASVSL